MKAHQNEHPTTVTWESLGDNKDDDGWHYVQKITVTGDTDMKGLAFNQFARKMKMKNPADTLTEIIPGYYLITSPRFGQDDDTLTFEIDTRGYMVNCSYQPDGFHRVLADDSAAPVNLVRKPLDDPKLHHAYTLPGVKSAEEIYRFNESLQTDWQPGVYDIIPSFASVTLLPTGGTSVNPKTRIAVNPELELDGSPNLAVITVRGGEAVVQSGNEHAARTASRVFEAKVLRPNPDVELPDAILVFDQEFGWRGMMIDIARNFQTPETLVDILNLMADNGLNKLHFHAVDDEAWRVELPSLPELTAVGSRRGWGLNEDDHLYQLFTGDGNPDNLDGTSNGYYSRRDMIRLLQTARELGIDVMPEIESPGHGRAAIRAMERRAKDGDPSFRLIQDNDTSTFTSAQSFHDNIMNPALESTYKFMETVIDDIVGLYREAGVPLTGIHIGGDEVPRGAWEGSPVVRKFMNDNGIEDEHAMHAYFVRRIARILAERGIPMYGWQEIALNHGDAYNAEIAPLTGGVNAWSTRVRQGQAPVPVRIAQGGFPVILSNVEHIYFDMSYSGHPLEQGLSWGGHTNEFTALDAYADKLCPMPDGTAGNVIGFDAPLWAETFRNADQLLMLITPKIFGLAERTAHPDTTYTYAQFNAIIGEKELPALEKRFAENKRGVFHLNQPGILVKDNVVYMNAPYTGGEIRYTLDGSVPTKDSPLYTGPFELKQPRSVRARYFRNGAASVDSFYLE